MRCWYCECGFKKYNNCCGCCCCSSSIVVLVKLEAIHCDRRPHWERVQWVQFHLKYTNTLFTVGAIINCPRCTSTPIELKFLVYHLCGSVGRFIFHVRFICIFRVLILLLLLLLSHFFQFFSVHFLHFYFYISLFLSCCCCALLFIGVKRKNENERGFRHLYYVHVHVPVYSHVAMCPISIILIFRCIYGGDQVSMFHHGHLRLPR